MAGVSPEEARAGIAARTAAREPGPRIDQVFDLMIPGLDAEITVRILSKPRLKSTRRSR